MVIVGIVGTALLGAGPAKASELPLELHWDAPDTCPNETELAAYIERHTVPSVAPRPAIQARATVRENPDGYSLALIITGETANARHDIDSRDCEALANATAFILAVALDPLAKSSEAKALADPAGESPPPSVPPREPTPTIDLDTTATAEEGRPPASTDRSEGGSSPRPKRTFGFVTAEAGVSAGQLGSAAPMFALTGGLRRGLARVGILGLYAPPLPRPLPPVPGATLGLSTWMLGGSGCVVPQVQRVEFPMCLELAAGQVRGRTRNIALPGDGSQTALTSMIAAGLTWSPRPALGFGVRAESWLNLLRGRFEVGGLGEVFRVPRAAFAAYGHFEIRFGSPR